VQTEFMVTGTVPTLCFGTLNQTSDFHMFSFTNPGNV